MEENLRNEILKKTYERDGQRYISLRNSRLDFSKEYLFYGFTDKTVKLGYENGQDIIKVQGKIEKRDDYYALYAEGWSFIEHIRLNEGI